MNKTIATCQVHFKRYMCHLITKNVGRIQRIHAKENYIFVPESWHEFGKLDKIVSLKICVALGTLFLVILVFSPMKVSGSHTLVV